MDQQQRKGQLVEWNDARGFGFIQQIGESQRFFAHISEFKGRRPQQGDVVFFCIGQNKKGQPCAVDIEYSKVLPSRAMPTYTIGSPRSVLAFGQFVWLALLIVMAQLPWWLLPWSMLISVITFAVYRSDKQRAQQQQWRTPENTLHVLALMGGWSGSLWAQLFLRHKSKKASFLNVFWFTVVVNVVVTGFWAMSEDLQHLGLMLDKP